MKTLLLAGWILKENLLGIPYVYFAPPFKDQQANISFSATDITVDLKDTLTLKKNQSDYQLGRKNWALRTGASILGFDPYEVTINQYGHRVHHIGSSYALDGDSYAEKTYYIECRGKLYVSKALRLNEDQAVAKDFDHLVNHMDCE
jgi:hypothetical protein